MQKIDHSQNPKFRKSKAKHSRASKSISPFVNHQRHTHRCVFGERGQRGGIPKSTTICTRTHFRASVRVRVISDTPLTDSRRISGSFGFDILDASNISITSRLFASSDSRILQSQYDILVCMEDHHRINAFNGKARMLACASCLNLTLMMSCCCSFME